MAYDNTAYAANPLARGLKGQTIDYSVSDVTLPASVKGVMVCAAGNVVYRPAGETSGSITITGAQVGLILPQVPGLIIKTGSTAVLCTIED
jgi:hypothetical protein